MADKEKEERCEICARSGKVSKLKVYQINFEEAIRFCEDEKCTYPLGLDQPSGIIVSRKYTDISNKGKETPTTSKLPTKPAQISLKKPLTSNHSFQGKKVMSPYVPGQTKNTSSQRNSTAMSLKAVDKQSFGAVKKSVLPTNTSRMPCQSVSNESVSKTQVLFPQWQNKDALCWLDVIMCILVHSKCVQELGHRDDGDVIATLIKAYDQAVELLNKTKVTSVCKSSNGGNVVKANTGNSETSDMARNIEHQPNSENVKDVVTKDMSGLSIQDKVKTGAGLQLLNTDFLPLVTEHGSEDMSEAFLVLSEIREKIWHMLHPRLKCQKGRNDSPVFAIPLLAKHSQDMEKILTVRYCFSLHCSHCGYEKKDGHEKVLPTFPKVPQDFSMKDPAFERNCFKCEAPLQRMRMEFKKLSGVLMLHFVEGLPHSRFADLDFLHDGVLYTVSGFVQYKNSPDHFVAWIREPADDLWMECNDLKSPLCQFKSRPPKVPASQIHIVMWEAAGHGNVCTSTNIKATNLGGIVEAMDTSGGSGDLPNSTQYGHSGKLLNEMSDHVGKNLVDGNIALSEYNGKDVSKSKVMTSLTQSANSRPLSNSVSNPNFTVGFLPSSQVMVPLCNSKIELVGSLKIGQSVTPSSSGLNVLKSKTVNVKEARNSFIRTEKLSSKEDPSKGLEKGCEDKGNEKKGNMSSSLALLRSLTANKSKNNPIIPVQTSVPRNFSGLGVSGLSKLQSNKSDKGILAKILSGRSSIPQTVKPCAKTRVYEGYRPKTEGSGSRLKLEESGSSSRNFSGYSTRNPRLEIMSGDSRPASPALSTHSDTVVVQKRKIDVALGGKSDNVFSKQKRRKSQDVPPNKLFRSKSIGGRYSTIESLVGKKNVRTYSVESSFEENSSGKDVNNESIQDNEECDILQHLYKSLNLAMPSDERSNTSANSQDAVMLNESMPDISELDKFIYGSSNIQNTADVSVDNLLSHL